MAAAEKGSAIVMEIKRFKWQHGPNDNSQIIVDL